MGSQRDDPTRLGLACADNVALLSFFTLAPSAPHDNIPTQSTKKDGRVLSFRRESRLARAIAFLSAISDDPNHVVAACVEESMNGAGMKVMIAINKETVNGAEKTLKSIKNGLDQVFLLLSRADSNKTEPSLENKTFNAIINMSQKRLCSRIRSKRPGVKLAYYKSEKAWFGTTVQAVILAVQQHYSGAKLSADIKQFLKNATAVKKCLDRVEKCHQQEELQCLKDLVDTAFQANLGSKLENILSRLSAKELNPTSAAWFINGLRKLAKYRECCGSLFRAAKRFGMFKKVTVVPVSLPATHFARIKNSNENRFAKCLERCQLGSHKTHTIQQVGSKLAGGLSESSLRSAATKILAEAKIHAEMQIVCHYELHPAAKMPRVICSNKDACYLCDLFLRLHGKFHVPRSHGNLYTGWRMALVPSLGPVLKRFNEALEARTGEAVRALMAGKSNRVTQRNDNESTLFSLTSLLSLEDSAVAVVPVPVKDKTQGKEGKDGGGKKGVKLVGGRGVVGVLKTAEPVAVEEKKPLASAIIVLPLLPEEKVAPGLISKEPNAEPKTTKELSTPRPDTTPSTIVVQKQQKVDTCESGSAQESGLQGSPSVPGQQKNDSEGDREAGLHIPTKGPSENESKCSTLDVITAQPASDVEAPVQDTSPHEERRVPVVDRQLSPTTNDTSVEPTACLLVHVPSTTLRQTCPITTTQDLQSSCPSISSEGSGISTDPAALVPLPSSHSSTLECVFNAPTSSPALIPLPFSPSIISALDPGRTPVLLPASPSSTKNISPCLPTPISVPPTHQHVPPHSPLVSPSPIPPPSRPVSPISPPSPPPITTTHHPLNPDTHPSPTPSQTFIPTPIPLSQNTPITLRLDNPLHPHKPNLLPVYAAGPITIYPEFCPSEEIRGPIEARVHWLSAAEADRVRKGRPDGYVSLGAEDITQGQTRRSETGTEKMWLECEGEVVEVEVTRWMGRK